MPLNEDVNKHFATNGNDMFTANAAINGLPRPTIMAGVLRFDNTPDGDLIEQFAQSVMAGEEVEVKPILSILRKNCMELIDMFKEESGSEVVAALQQLIVFDKFVVLAQSTEISSNQDKEDFVIAVEAITEDISSKMNATPIMSIMIGEVWSFQLRKSWVERLNDLPKPTQESMKKTTMDKIYSAYGSIANIPEDHPAVVKFDCFMFFAQFNTNGGERAVMGMKMIDESKFDEMDSNASYDFNSLNFLKETNHQGRLCVDISKFIKIKATDEDED